VDVQCRFPAQAFPIHDAHTAQWAGLKGEKNGELLRAAEVAGYDVLLTVDQGITTSGPPRAGGNSVTGYETPKPDDAEVGGFRSLPLEMTEAAYNES